MHLDKTDLTILSKLEHNARMTHTELAKITRKSKDSIGYRIRRLKEEGILGEAGCFVDYTKLGLTAYKLYLLVDPHVEEYKAVVAWLKTKNNLFGIFEAVSSWNIGVVVFVKDVLEFEEFEQELNERFGKNILQSTLCHMTSAIVYAERNGTEAREIRVWGSIENNEIDNIDREILSKLLTNGTARATELAGELSIEATIKRLRRLQDIGVISFFSYSVNHEKLGKSVYKVFFYLRNLNKKQKVTFITDIGRIEQTLNIINTIGPLQMEVEFNVKSFDELYSLVNSITQKYSEYVARLEIVPFKNYVYFPAGLRS